MCIKAPFSSQPKKDNLPPPKGANAVPAAEQADITSGLVVFPNIASDSVLPTFTFSISDHDNLLRGLKDSGSQSTFASKKLYDLDLRLLMITYLSITGFNGTKSYKSKVVKVPIRIRDCSFSVSAMVVPDINIKLNLPLLGTVVEAFQYKGYCFAGALLTKSTQTIGNTEVLLGSDAAHCILGKDLMFGETKPSIFIESYAGIMPISNISNLVKQLNIYKDKNGLLRLCNKFERFHKDGKTCYFPILLPKDSRITELIIRDLHVKLAHSSLYVLLNEMRKRFYIPRFFSVVKKVISNCITCRKINVQTIKLNQNSYRDFRVNPLNVLLAIVFLDYMGPFHIKQGYQKVKVWILVITCMWS